VPPDRALRDALELLERIANADGKRLMLFLDEFQEFAAPRKPYGDPDAITRQPRAVMQDSPSVTVLFAGSIEHVMRDLFGPADRLCASRGGIIHTGCQPTRLFPRRLARSNARLRSCEPAWP
jgi:hypothetical protein